MERPHRKVVGAAVVDSELIFKVVKRVKAVTGVEAFLILPVAALDLAVVAWSIWTNKLVPDAELSGSVLKEGGNIPF